MNACLEIPTSWGLIRVVACDGLLVSCSLPPRRRADGVPLRCIGAARRSGAQALAPLLRDAGRFVRAALKGRAAPCPPLPGLRTPFQRRVRRVLLGLAPGTTMTYAEVARAAGSPRAARAAGSACAKNPLPLFVPCHRVLAAGGRLGGFSAGLPWKAELLAREGGARSVPGGAP